ncbi:MAG: PQQ-binding-like beta-propeller repeat protein, partial [Planctomycetota bacterium]
EYMDLVGDDHGQNNWLRGACKLGIMPCNGLLYVPADQCFCQPGAKVLGFTACAAEQPGRLARVPDEVRLTKGAAYGKLGGVPPAASNDDWPTFRQGASRHGSNQSEAPAEVLPVWRTQLPAPLTQPVMCAGRVYVAAKDAHTVFAVDASTGEVQWKFTAGARIDSPPTIYGDAVLVGSADGHVYCLRASDGELAWRLLAARQDCRIANFDQLESVWPVHGSVLVDGGVAYVTAGRSSYLDGGVDILALDPLSGRVLHRTTVSGPMPTLEARDEAFYLPGANSDVLVSEGRSIFMRQKQFSPELEPIESEVLSNKGEKNIGLHVFSTSGLLDDSWYNRAFWMYAKRWPGFQLAWQAPKAGQLLVMDDENTYGLKVYYRRNVHSPMFFPGKEGYLIFADRNTTEPQIVGEPGAKPPVEWLPQSDLPRDEINRLPLDSPAFGLDKMMGYTRAEPPLWTTWVPIRVRAMAKAGGTLLVAGARDEFEPADPFASFEGRSGALLASIAATDGRKLGEVELPAVPVFDGLIVACGRVFASLEDGSLICLAGNEPRADARP